MARFSRKVGSEDYRTLTFRDIPGCIEPSRTDANKGAPYNTRVGNHVNIRVRRIAYPGIGRRSHYRQEMLPFADGDRESGRRGLKTKPMIILKDTKIPSKLYP